MDRDNTFDMQHIKLEAGDTLGGTVPITLMHQIRPIRARAFGIARRRNASRAKWLWAVVLSVGAVMVPFFL